MLEKKQNIDSEKKEYFTLNFVKNDLRKTLRGMSLEREKQVSIIENKQKNFLRLLLIHNLCLGIKEHMEVTASIYHSFCNKKLLR